MSQIPLNSIPGNPIDVGTGNFTAPFVRFIQLVLGNVNLANAAVTNQTVVAVNGGTATINSTATLLYLTPAGTISTYTAVFPPSATDGTVVTIKTTQTITTLTLSVASPVTILDPVTTLAAKAFVKYTYLLSSNIWIRTG